MQHVPFVSTDKLALADMACPTGERQPPCMSARVVAACQYSVLILPHQKPPRQYYRQIQRVASTVDPGRDRFYCADGDVDLVRAERAGEGA
jgi:hypothetical protein